MQNTNALSRMLSCPPCFGHPQPVRRPRKRTLGFALLFFAAIFGLATLLQLREPRYQGRSLSQWLSVYRINASSLQKAALFNPGMKVDSAEFAIASEAIRHIGSKAVPYLLKRFAHEPASSSLRDKIVFWLGDMPPAAVCIPIRDRLFDDQRILHGEQGLFGFAALGSNAMQAIPELTRLANSQTKDNVPIWATAALGHIGPRAIPQLLEITTNKQAVARFQALLSLQAFGSNAVPALPGILQCINDDDGEVAQQAVCAVVKMNLPPSLVVPTLATALKAQDSMARAGAANALGKFGSDAGSSTSALRAALLDRDPEVRREASNALFKITAEFSPAK